MNLRPREAARLGFWRALGADELTAQHLEAACRPLPKPRACLPLPDEAQTDFYLSLPTQGLKLLQDLSQAFPQLCFVPEPGLSQSHEWAAAVRRGEPRPLPEPLPLREKEGLELRLMATPAGALPALVAGCREDFVLLVQLLAHRGEPVAVPSSTGALLIQGLVNWQRFRHLRQKVTTSSSQKTWEEVWAELAPQKWLYQDRLVLASRGPYSGVTAPPHLEPSAWLQTSLVIRLAHEATHYVTLRLFGKLGHTVLEELVADWVGLGTAGGGYRPDLARAFLGVETPPHFRLGGRLANYQPPGTSPQAFCYLVLAVSKAIDRLATLPWPAEAGLAKALPELLALSLEELASGEAWHVTQEQP